MNAPTTKKAVYALEHELANLPQAEVPIRHYFADGLYAREMKLPAGVAATGAVHKTEHICVISQGSIAVTTDEGVKVLTAPCTFVAKPGIKRAGYAITDVVWTTFHATKETEINKILEELIEEEPDKLIGGKNNVQALRNVEQLK